MQNNQFGFTLKQLIMINFINMKEQLSFPLVIVGGGPIGLACALSAAAAGIPYCILEKGCLVNSLYNYPANMTFFSTSEKLEIGGVPFVSNNFKPTRNEALEYYRRVATNHQLNIRLQEKVEKIQKVEGGFLIESSKHQYLAQYVIIATGFYDIPYKMHVPGENLPKVTHYYKDPHFYAMQKVLVVGANNSAVDAALETYRKGAEVTMVIRGEGIGRRVKYWAKPDIENRIEEGSIKAYTNSSIKAIHLHTVDIQTADGVITVENDYVIAMTGYQPDFSLLNTIGVQLSDDGVSCPYYNEQTMESNITDLYLAGVVCGGLNTHVWFIENSREHAIKIIQDIQSKIALKS
jgi:thioredoxin reductase (NADPH)